MTGPEIHTTPDRVGPRKPPSTAAVLLQNFTKLKKELQKYPVIRFRIDKDVASVEPDGQGGLHVIVTAPRGKEMISIVFSKDGIIENAEREVWDSRGKKTASPPDEKELVSILSKLNSKTLLRLTQKDRDRLIAIAREEHSACVIPGTGASSWLLRRGQRGEVCLEKRGEEGESGFMLVMNKERIVEAVSRRGKQRTETPVSPSDARYELEGFFLDYEISKLKGTK